MLRYRSFSLDWVFDVTWGKTLLIPTVQFFNGATFPLLIIQITRSIDGNHGTFVPLGLSVLVTILLQILDVTDWRRLQFFLSRVMVVIQWLWFLDETPTLIIVV